CPNGGRHGRGANADRDGPQEFSTGMHVRLDFRLRAAIGVVRAAMIPRASLIGGYRIPSNGRTTPGRRPDEIVRGIPKGNTGAPVESPATAETAVDSRMRRRLPSSSGRSASGSWRAGA